MQSIQPSFPSSNQTIVWIHLYVNVIKKTSNQPSKETEQRDKEKRQYTHDNGLL